MRKRIVVCAICGGLGFWAGGWVGEHFEFSVIVARTGCALAGAVIGYVFSQMLDVMTQGDEEETS